MNATKKIIEWYFSKNSLPFWAVLLLDSLNFYIAGLFVFLLFNNGVYILGNIKDITIILFIYCIINFIGYKAFRTYSGIIRYSSFVDFQHVSLAMLLSFIISEFFNIAVIQFNLPFIELTKLQIATIYLIATIGMMLLRIIVKSLYDLIFDSKQKINTLIYGIYEGGIGIAQNITSDNNSKFRLKGFISNDKVLKNKYLIGQRVYTVSDNLLSILKSLDIKAVLVSSIQVDKFRNNTKLQDLLINNDISIYIAENSKEWNKDDQFSNIKLKEIAIEDLLPRDIISSDMNAISAALSNKRIMVTGSAGSIGSEIVRQLSKFNPSKLILIDQAETPQHDIKLMMKYEYPKVDVETIVGNISNIERMEILFRTYKPEYVFHAAAYKHVPMMEDNPSESIQNNIVGTKIIADLSVKYGVQKFLMISTDKAVNPTNVMGCSKRICEIYCQSLNHKINSNGNNHTTTQFVTTRFGNVLGSSGSVIPLFKKQIKNGGPVTVTDPNIVRYFMLIQEACKLVLEAGIHGNGGEIFVFDMGKPVKIADLARRMIKLSGAKDISIVYTGLRAGEKLCEEVLSSAENTLPSFHEKIRIAKVRKSEYDLINKQIEELDIISHKYNNMDIVKKMKEIVPEYVSNNSKYSILDNN